MKQVRLDRVFVTVFLCLTVFSPCVVAQAQPKANAPFACPPPLGLEARVALGNRTTDILLGAAHVQTFCLLTNTHRDQLGTLARFQSHAGNFVSQGNFGEYMSIDHAGLDQGQAFVAQAKHALFDNELYDLGGLAKCFDPGVGLRFWKGREHVDVALCFECGQLSITTFDAHNKRIHEIPQLAMGFDQPLFVHLIQPAFPKDAEIQAIKAYTLPPEVRTPEARVAQENDLREAIFLHLMTKEKLSHDSTKAVYYLSTGPTDSSPADPPPALLRRFLNRGILVRPATARHPDTAQMTAVNLRAAHLWWIDSTTVYAEATCGTTSGKTYSFTYGLTKIDGRWTVSDDKSGWGN